METELAISFIIPMHNEDRTIAQCLDAIDAERAGNDEIIVVDNGSTDHSIAIVNGFSKVALLLKPGVKVAALRNAGARRAGGDLLVFIDADCVVCKGYRNNLLAAFKEPGVGASGSKVDLPSNPHWIEKAWYSQKRYTTGKVKYINSGNLAVRKKIFDEIGGFDETLITGEDSELCWRLNRAGYAVVEYPEVRAIHYGNPKDLGSFYKQQQWHGLGMFGTLRISWINKPFIMTLLFICSTLSAIVSPYLLRDHVSVATSLLTSLGLILFVPFVTSLYRVLQFKNYAYFFHLMVLYLLFYTARSVAFFRVSYLTVRGDG
jgi:cellulose synthase/poly-beta-1,6-N-acetylglucosamine synthase-like glycosyltransferase